MPRKCDKYSLWSRYGQTREQVATAEWRHLSTHDTYDQARNHVGSSRAVYARQRIKLSEFQIVCAGERPT